METRLNNILQYNIIMYTFTTIYRIQYEMSVIAIIHHCSLKKYININILYMYINNYFLWTTLEIQEVF